MNILEFSACPAYVPKRLEMASDGGRFMANWYEAVVFDLDGTLVDTAPDILAYLNEMLAELERPGLDLADIRPMIGDGVKSLMLRGLEASGGLPEGLDFDALFKRYLARYTADPARHSRPFEGVIEALDAFRDAGIKMGVCTNKPQAPTDSLLAKLDLARYFPSVIGGDALAVKKPDPIHLLTVLDQLDTKPEQAVLVGDSETDLKTARAAGIPCILVSFGYTKSPAVDLGADHVIDHYDDLIPSLLTIKPSPA